MIGKGTRGSGFRGVLEYVFGPGKHHKPNRASLVGGTMSGVNPRTLAREFGELRKLRPDVGNPVKHISLRLADSEYLSDLEWQDVGANLATAHGWDTYVIVRHNDEPQDHVHVIGSRIRSDGRVSVETSFDVQLTENVCRAAEVQYGLTKVVSPERTKAGKMKKPKVVRETGPEMAVRQRTGNKSAKVKLQQIIDHVFAKDQPKNLKEFEEYLARDRVTLVANQRGGTLGVSYTLGGKTMKGSNLGTNYAGKGVQTRIAEIAEASHAQIRQREVLELGPVQHPLLDRDVARVTAMAADLGRYVNILEFVPKNQELFPVKTDVEVLVPMPIIASPIELPAAVEEAAACIRDISPYGLEQDLADMDEWLRQHYGIPVTQVPAVEGNEFRPIYAPTEDLWSVRRVDLAWDAWSIVAERNAALNKWCQWAKRMHADSNQYAKQLESDIAILRKGGWEERKLLDLRLLHPSGEPTWVPMGRGQGHYACSLSPVAPDGLEDMARKLEWFCRLREIRAQGHMIMSSPNADFPGVPAQTDQCWAIRAAQEMQRYFCVDCPGEREDRPLILRRNGFYQLAGLADRVVEDWQRQREPKRCQPKLESGMEQKERPANRAKAGAIMMVGLGGVDAEEGWRGNRNLEPTEISRTFGPKREIADDYREKWRCR